MSMRTIAVARRIRLTAHSLNQSDRDILKSAGSKVSTHAKVGSLLGVGLGVYCAFRLRSMRLSYFNAFRAMEKPVEVRFADGRTGMESRPCTGICILMTPQNPFLISPSNLRRRNGAMQPPISSSLSEVYSLVVRRAS
jgi:hypothetical protein